MPPFIIFAIFFRYRDEKVKGWHTRWSHVDVQRWLSRHYEDAHPGKRLPRNYYRDQLRPYLKQVIRFAFITGENTGHQLAKSYAVRGTVNMPVAVPRNT